MYQALHIAKTGLAAQDYKMRTVSNNLANVSTIGFKRDRANFESLQYQNIRQPGSATGRGIQSPTGTLVGSGVRFLSSEKNQQQGSLISTGNSLDMAIQGVGFFQVVATDGALAYTRDGTFSRNSNGDLVTPRGHLVEPAINIPEGTTSISIGADGRVSVTVGGGNESREIGQISLATFPNSSGLKPVGNNMYNETDSSGAPRVSEAGQNGVGKIEQGFLEGSNVNIHEELVSIIELQRGFDLQTKVVSAVSSSMKFLIQNT